MAIAPIQGMLRRSLVVNISTALGLGVSGGYAFWYGYHLPTVQKRDTYYAKLEEERARNLGQ